MKRINIPGTDLEVSNISYGTTGFDGTFPEDQGLELVRKYLEFGGNFIDTAHCYAFWMPNGGGASERFVGKAVKTFGRNSMIVATKGGHVGVPPDYPRPDAFMEPELVQKDLTESLERLELDQVDLYYLHRDDPRMPVDEIISAVNGFVNAGQVRYLGASNWSVERYRAANAYAQKNGLHPFVVLQNEWSLAHPSSPNSDAPGSNRTIDDKELEPLGREDIAVAAYTPTANGYFATDGVRGRRNDNQVSRQRLARVQKLAAEKGWTQNQVALAYLLNHPFPTIAVIGTRDPAHLADAVGASELVLSQEHRTFLST
jgi:aryl-alcohol dehydrogenase-like predicted oxidoreductase